MAGSVLLRARNSKMSANAYRLSALLWHGGAEKQFYSRACHWGLCMSHKKTLNKIDEMGENFDEDVLQWKANTEHDCKLERMLDTIAECAEDMIEVIPEGMETVNVTELGLSYIASQFGVQHSDSDVTPGEGVMECRGEDPAPKPLLPADDPDLKKRFAEKLVERFYEQIFDCLVKYCRVVIDYGCTDLENTEKLKILKRQLQLGHAAGYQIIGDNLDMLIKVKHMSSTNQNKSIHWFNLNAVINRVLGNDKPNTDRIKPALELENIDFLPSAVDNDNFSYDLIPLVARVIADRVSAFSKFQNAVVRHIPHQYSDLMKEKSMQVPLGLLFKSENKNEEMIDIMQDIHDKYVLTSKPSDNESGEEMFIDVLEKLFFVGDQLSFERGTNSTGARCDGDTEFERLEADTSSSRLAFWQTFVSETCLDHPCDSTIQDYDCTNYQA